MKYLPLFIRAENRRIAVCGGGALAEAKIRLLLKSSALVHVFSKSEPTPAICSWAKEGSILLHRRDTTEVDVISADLVYAAHMKPELDNPVLRWAKEAEVWVNAVDRQEDSDFISPAVVDRDPVIVAIGTEGSGPVLARWLKAQLEALLPTHLGPIAKLAKSHRAEVKHLPSGKSRRSFWQSFFGTFLSTPRLLQKPRSEIDAVVAELVKQCANTTPSVGRVDFIGAGPGDADLITVKGSRILQDADVVLHDRLVGESVLDLARREALLIDVGKKGFGPGTSQTKINAIIVDHAREGSHVARLKGGDPSVFGRLDEEIEACQSAGVSWQVVPGVTTASAASASLGRSLTRRKRNQEVIFLTGHNLEGFAEQDWQRLAMAGRVFAIYMGRKSSQFLQSRLLMFGADPETPVQCLEDVSLPTETLVSGCLRDFAQLVQSNASDRPLMILYGVGSSTLMQSEYRSFQGLNRHSEARHHGIT